MNHSVQFLPIDIEKNWKLCLQFRIDSYVSSFGSTENFEKDGGESHYKEWLQQKIIHNPYSAVHVFLNGNIIGQMELGRLKKQPEIGLVNLYYLSPDYRGKNLSIYLDKYAEEFLTKNGHRVAQLNVSPTNLRAVRFYLKNGWNDLGPNPQNPCVHTMEKILK